MGAAGEPQPGAELPITFGPSFGEEPAGTSYSCFRYEFKPQSTKREREGQLVRTGKDITVEFPGDGHPVAFTGHLVPSRDNLDGVLVVDGGSVRLEQLTGTVMLKHTRGTGVGLGNQGRATPPLPPAGSKRARGAGPETPASGSGRPGAPSAPAGGLPAPGALTRGGMGAGAGSSSSSSSSSSDDDDDEGTGGGGGGLPAPAATPQLHASHGYNPPSSAPLLPRFGVGVGLGATQGGGGGSSSASGTSSGSSSDGDRSLDEVDDAVPDLDVI